MAETSPGNHNSSRSASSRPSRPKGVGAMHRLGPKRLKSPGQRQLMRKGVVGVLGVLRSRKNWSVALAGVAVIGTFAAVAFGSLGVGFTPTNLVTASIPDNIDLN